MVGSETCLPMETSRFSSSDLWVGRWMRTHLSSLAGFNGHWAEVTLVTSLSGLGTVGLVRGFLGVGSLIVLGLLSSSWLWHGKGSFRFLHAGSTLSKQRISSSMSAMS